VWQGRFKAFAIQDDDHLTTVLRYVERNPLRAELVARAQDWKWSSLPGWISGDPLLWRGPPEPRDARWLSRVNKPLSAGDLQRLRHSVQRGRPFGNESWTEQTAVRLGLESCLRPPGRPKRTDGDSQARHALKKGTGIRPARGSGGNRGLDDEP
jgi:putative transposase